MSDLLPLTQALDRTMRDHAPGWTDRNDADPGITMLEILAYLAKELQFHRGPVAGGSGASSRIVQALDAYEDDDPIVVRVNGEQWERVRAIGDAPPDASVFTFDETTGIIAFGDGVHGRVPERGSTISARYQTGGGAEMRTSFTVRSTWPSWSNTLNERSIRSLFQPMRAWSRAASKRAAASRSRAARARAVWLSPASFRSRTAGAWIQRLFRHARAKL
jgi:hypothetical protein